MTNFRRATISIVLLGSAALAGKAWQKDDRAITLDVVVAEKSGGTPVLDLHQQDFTLLDNKAPQKILSFRPPSTAEPAEVVLLLDEVNSAFNGVSQATNQAEKFLKQSGARLAWPTVLVFFTDKGLTAASETPTQDTAALMSELHANRAPLRVIGRAQGYYGASDRVGLSLSALGQIAATEQSRPGRKLLVWISPGWALLSGPRQDLTSKDETNIFRSVVGLSAALRNSHTTLYSVDPLGSADTVGLRTTYWEAYDKPAKKPEQVQIGDLALQVLAQQSGGLVLNSSNDVAGEIAQCFADAHSAYEISFEAQTADGPDDYHSLEVKVDRPKAKARTRAGYYAEPEQSSTR
jgi:VWFA-related protein